MGSRLHPAAIAVYAADALRQGALPLLVILGVSVFGGGFDADAAIRGAMFALIGTGMAALAGAFRWSTTRYSLAGDTMRLREGMLSVKEVEIPFTRVQAVDVEQGPIQRLFGVYSSRCRRAAAARAASWCSGRWTRPRSSASARWSGAARALPRRGRRRRSGGSRGAGSPRGGDLGPARRAAAGRGGGRPDGPAAVRRPDQGERTIVGALPDGAVGWGLLAAGCWCWPGCWRRSAPSSASAASRSAARATSCGSAAGCCSAARRRCGSAGCGRCA